MLLGSLKTKTLMWGRIPQDGKFDILAQTSLVQTNLVQTSLAQTSLVQADIIRDAGYISAIVTLTCQLSQLFPHGYHGVPLGRSPGSGLVSLAAAGCCSTPEAQRTDLPQERLYAQTRG